MLVERFSEELLYHISILMLLYRIIVKMWGFYSRCSHFFSWCDLLTPYMSTVLWIYLKSFFLPSIWLHSTGTLRQHGLFGWNTGENSCGFWIEWLDQAGIQQKEAKLKPYVSLHFRIFPLPCWFWGGCHNTEAYTYNVKIKNTHKCWSFLVLLPPSGRARFLGCAEESLLPRMQFSTWEWHTHTNTHHPRFVIY